MFSLARWDSRSGSELPSFRPASGIEGQSLPWGLCITSASKGRELHPHENEVAQENLCRMVVTHHFPSERIARTSSCTSRCRPGPCSCAQRCSLGTCAGHPSLGPP